MKFQELWNDIPFATREEIRHMAFVSDLTLQDTIKKWFPEYWNKLGYDVK